MDKEDQYSPQFEEQLRISIHLAERAATKKQLAIIEKKMADKKKSISSSIKAFFFNLLSSLVVPDKAIFWVPNVIKFLKNNPQLVKSCDLIYSTSPAFSNHLIARFIKKNNA